MRRGELGVNKVVGIANCSNIMTKHVGWEEIEEQCKRVGMEIREGISKKPQNYSDIKYDGPIGCL